MREICLAQLDKTIGALALDQERQLARCDPSL